MTILSSSCPICEGQTGLWDTVNGYRLERCRRCGFVFVNPRPDRREIEELYRTAGGHFGQQSSSLDEVLDRERFFPNSTVDAARMIRNVARVVARGDRLLDVGSGYGLYTREALNQGFIVDALEIAPFERSCSIELTGIIPIDVAFEEFSEKPDSYGVVLMSQILEHAVDINEWLAKANRLLHRGGILCVAVPNFGSFLRRVLGARDPLLNPPTHLNYFSPPSAQLLIEKHGFNIQRIETVSRIPPDAISKRIARAPHLARDFSEWVLRVGQLAPLAILDRMQFGIFLNVYAVRP